MRTIEAYAASDGTKFYDRKQCEIYEDELRLVDRAGIKINFDSTLGHGEWRQHDRETLLAIKRKVFELVLQKFGDRFPQWRESNPDDVHPMSGVGRVLSDYGGPIANVWGQLARFNFDLGREYDQPYFANHPEESIPAKEQA